MASTSVRLHDDLEAPLRDLAAKLDRSKSYIINQSLREYLDRHALEEQRWKDTEEALADVEAGRVIPGEEVERWLRSWGTDNELPPPGGSAV